MGFLGDIAASSVAGGLEGAGVAATDIGKRWNEQEFQKQRDEATDLRQQNLARLNAILAQETHAKGVETNLAALPKELAARNEGAVAGAKALGPVTAANKGLIDQAELDIKTKPENVRAGAQAKVDELKITGPAKVEQDRLAALGAADTAKALAADPAYLAAQRAITSANETSATRAAAAHSMMETALAKVKIGQAQVVADAHTAYKAAVESGDQTKIQQARASIDAAMYDSTVDKAQLTATAGVIKTMSTEIERLTIAKNNAIGTDKETSIQRQIDQAKSTHDALVADFNRRTGVSDTGVPAPGKTGWDSASGSVFKDGKEIGTAKTEAEARKIVAGGGAAAKSATPAAPATAKPPEEPSYVPPVGSQAAAALARREGATRARAQTAADQESRTSATRAAFNDDAAAMPKSDLLKKYDGTELFDQLSVEQKRQLFSIRNPRP